MTDRFKFNPCGILSPNPGIRGGLRRGGGRLIAAPRSAGKSSPRSFNSRPVDSIARKYGSRSTAVSGNPVMRRTSLSGIIAAGRVRRIAARGAPRAIGSGRAAALKATWASAGRTESGPPDAGTDRPRRGGKGSPVVSSLPCRGQRIVGNGPIILLQIRKLPMKRPPRDAQALAISIEWL